MRTQNTSLTHVFDKNVKYGTTYQFTVQTDDPNAQKSPKYTVKTLPIPVPAGLTTFLNVNASTHEIAWNIPNKLPSYLQKKVNAQKIQYRYEFRHTFTLFENYSKCIIWILAFSTNFCPIKTDMSGNTIWPQASVFQKLAKSTIFGIFN